MKKIVIVLVIISFLLITGGTIYYFRNLSKKEKPAEEKEKVYLIDSFNERSEPSEKQKELMNTLSDWGKQLYEKKEYTSYEGQGGVYFISLKDLKEKYSYDISIFHNENGNKCDVNKTGIYFDTENVLGRRFDSGNYIPYFPLISNC
jgi:tRNA A37 N6-isopentenylltransferase MiaA